MPLCHLPIICLEVIEGEGVRRLSPWPPRSRAWRTGLRESRRASLNQSERQSWWRARGQGCLRCDRAGPILSISIEGQRRYPGHDELKISQHHHFGRHIVLLQASKQPSKQEMKPRKGVRKVCRILTEFSFAATELNRSHRAAIFERAMVFSQESR